MSTRKSLSSKPLAQRSTEFIRWVSKLVFAASLLTAICVYLFILNENHRNAIKTVSIDWPIISLVVVLAATLSANKIVEVFTKARNWFALQPEKIRMTATSFLLVFIVIRVLGFGIEIGNAEVASMIILLALVLLPSQETISEFLTSRVKEIKGPWFSVVLSELKEFENRISIERENIEDGFVVSPNELDRLIGLIERSKKLDATSSLLMILKEINSKIIEISRSNELTKEIDEDNLDDIGIESLLHTLIDRKLIPDTVEDRFTMLWDIKEQIFEDPSYQLSPEKITEYIIDGAKILALLSAERPKTTSEGINGGRIDSTASNAMEISSVAVATVSRPSTTSINADLVHHTGSIIRIRVKDRSLANRLWGTCSTLNISTPEGKTITGIPGWAKSGQKRNPYIAGPDVVSYIKEDLKISFGEKKKCRLVDLQGCNIKLEIAD